MESCSSLIACSNCGVMTSAWLCRSCNLCASAMFHRELVRFLLIRIAGRCIPSFLRGSADRWRKTGTAAFRQRVAARGDREPGRRAPPFPFFRPAQSGNGAPGGARGWRGPSRALARARLRATARLIAQACRLEARAPSDGGGCASRRSTGRPSLRSTGHRKELWPHLRPSFRSPPPRACHRLAGFGRNRVRGLYSWNGGRQGIYRFSEIIDLKK